MKADRPLFWYSVLPTLFDDITQSHRVFNYMVEVVLGEINKLEMKLSMGGLECTDCNGKMNDFQMCGRML